MASANLGSETPSYEESARLVPAPASWVLLAISVFIVVELAWNWFRGESDLIYSVPGAFGFLAIGVGAAVARLYVQVTPAEVRVGNSPRLSRGIRLVELQEVAVREEAPSRWTPGWPFSRRRVYSLGGGGGVLLTVSSGEEVFIGSRDPARLAEAIVRSAPHVCREEGRGRTRR